MTETYLNPPPSSLSLEHLRPIIVAASAPQVPVVASVPHGGLLVPQSIAESLLVDLDRNYADWYTPDLYSFLPKLGVWMVVALAHRLVADVNRSPMTPLGPAWKGIVQTTSYRDEPMYAEPPSDAEVQARIAAVHKPYHGALDDLIEEAIAQFGTVLLLDLHSFGMPLGVDIVLGDANDQTAPPRIVNLVEDAFVEQGFSVRRNDPFSSGWIIRKFAADPRVHALIVEINQRIYLDRTEIDRPDWRRPSFVEGRVSNATQRLRPVFERVIKAVTGSGSV